jgi:hypothetical protein
MTIPRASRTSPPPHRIADPSRDPLQMLAHRGGKRLDLRFPSIAGVARLIRRASKTNSASAVAGPGSNEYYSG